MKIGFMANYFYPATGGMEELTFGIAKELVKRGHEVHVFTSDRKDGKYFGKEQIVDGVRIHRSKLWFAYKYYLKFNPGIAFRHLKYDLDVIHFQSFGFLFQDVAVVLRRLFTNTKLVNSPHGPFMSLDKYPLWQSVFRSLYVAFEYPVNMLYHNVIQVNPEQYKWMVKYGVRKDCIKFIPNSMPESVFAKASGKLVKKLGLEGKFVISYLGRVQKYKGLEQVVRVLPSLVKVNPNVVFLAMGGEVDGEYARLKKIAKELGVSENLVIAGRVSEDEKLSGLDCSEVFVLPSEWEAFGIVLTEAMARGCAVVSSKTEGGNFVVGPKEGFLYKYKDLDGLREALLALVTKDELRVGMQKHNYKKSKEYLVSNIVEKFEELYSR